MPLHTSAASTVKFVISRNNMKTCSYLVTESFIQRLMNSLHTALASFFIMLTLNTLKTNRSFRVCVPQELTRTVTLWLRSTSASMIAHMLSQCLYSPGNTTTLPAWPTSTPHSSINKNKLPEIMVKYFCFWISAVWSPSWGTRLQIYKLFMQNRIWAKVMLHYRV